MCWVSASVAVSEAGSKIINPYDLQPYDTNQPHYKWPNYVSSADSTTAHFYAVVLLPVGKTVKKLEYYHEGFSGTVGTAVYLNRQLPGEPFHKAMASLNGLDPNFQTY